MSIPDDADERVAVMLFEGAAGRPSRGPNKMAEDAEALLRELIPQRDAAKSRKERKQLSSRIKSARILRDWAKSRAGYV